MGLCVADPKTRDLNLSEELFRLIFGVAVDFNMVTYDPNF